MFIDVLCVVTHTARAYLNEIRFERHRKHQRKIVKPAAEK